MSHRVQTVLVAVAGTALLVVSVGMPGRALYRYITRGPILRVENPDRELPLAERSSSIPRVIFPIQNTGNAELDIKKIATSCGCTVVESPKKALAPGEKASIVVTATRPPVGTVTVFITVRTNSSREPVTRLSITGFGEMEVPYVQNHCDWVYLPAVKNAGEKREFWLSAIENEAEKPWIGELISTLPFLGVEILNSKSNPYETGFVERLYRCRVTVTELPDIGTFSGSIRIPAYDLLELPVFVRVLGPIVASPPALFAGGLPSQDSRELDFRIIKTGSAFPVKSLKVRAPEGVAVTQAEPETEQEIVFRVSIRGLAPNSELLREIMVVAANEQSTFTLRIPLYVSLLPTEPYQN